MSLVKVITGKVVVAKVPLTTFCRPRQRGKNHQGKHFLQTNEINEKKVCMFKCTHDVGLFLRFFIYCLFFFCVLFNSIKIKSR